MTGRLNSLLQTMPRWLPRNPRTLAAVVLLIFIAVIVGIGKLIGPAPATPSGAVGPPSTTSSTLADPGTGDDGVAASQSASIAPAPSGAPDALAVATTFAKGWLHGDRSPRRWRDALLPHCTENLAAALEGVNPAGVPATRITAEARIESHAASYLDAVIPMDAGLLRLRMIASPDVDGERRWLVDGIDWERA